MADISKIRLPNNVTYDLAALKVAQVNTNSNINYRLLLSSSATNETETDVINKSSSLIYNPNSGILTTGTGLNCLVSGINVPLISCNGTQNIWIGAEDSTSPGHTGEIYINSGINASTGEPNSSIKIAIPNAENTQSTSYEVIHKGNIVYNIESSIDSWETVNVPLSSSNTLHALRGGKGQDAATPPIWFAEKYGAGIVFGGSDTAGIFSVSRLNPKITIAGGVHSSEKTKPTWYIHLTGTNETTYNLDDFLVTDTKVTQVNTTQASEDFRILFSENANDTTETTTIRKSANLKFNPVSGLMTITGRLSASGATFSSSQFAAPLTIERLNSNQNAAITFKNANGVLGYVGMGEVDGDLIHFQTNTSNAFAILDAGNTTTQSIGSASVGTAISVDDITSWNAGTIPSLTTTTKSIPNVTENTNITIKSVKTINTGVLAATISQGILTFSTGAVITTEDKTATNTTLGTAISIKSVNEWNAGSVPSLDYTSKSVPNISVTNITNVLRKN